MPQAPTALLPLCQQRCSHQSGQALSDAGQVAMLTQIKGWGLEGGGTDAVLHQTFSFADYHRTLAFVNAVAWIAHEQDHHPDMTLSHNRCTVRWSTHSVGGLSINDFICAARVDQLLA